MCIRIHFCEQRDTLSVLTLRERQSKNRKRETESENVFLPLFNISSMTKVQVEL